MKLIQLLFILIIIPIDSLITLKDYPSKLVYKRDIQLISWNSSESYNKTRIDLYQNKKFIDNLYIFYNNRESIQWFVSPNLPIGNHFNIKITTFSNNITQSILTPKFSINYKYYINPYITETLGLLIFILLWIMCWFYCYCYCIKLYLNISSKNSNHINNNDIDDIHSNIKSSKIIYIDKHIVV